MIGRSCKPESRPWPNCNPNAFISLAKPKSVGRGPYERDLVRADTRLHEIDRCVHPRASLGVRIALGRRRAPTDIVR